MDQENHKIKIYIERDENSKDLPLPKPESLFASGVDLCSAEKEPVEIKPGEWKLISTGLKIAIPTGYEAQVRPRSGLAFKKGITVLNTPGTIDSDYRGTIKIILMNHSHDSFLVKKGDRIAQLIFQKVYQPLFIETDKLDSTKRGEGGFGHTGIQVDS